jgi:hypothetical protein
MLFHLWRKVRNAKFDRCFEGDFQVSFGIRHKTAQKNTTAVALAWWQVTVGSACVDYWQVTKLTVKLAWEKLKLFAEKNCLFFPLGEFLLLSFLCFPGGINLLGLSLCHKWLSWIMFKHVALTFPQALKVSLLFYFRTQGYQRLASQNCSKSSILKTKFHQLKHWIPGIFPTSTLLHK